MVATGGLNKENSNSFENALKLLETSQCVSTSSAAPPPGPCDSDGDGKRDIAELRDNEDPNVPGPGNLCSGPRYGCGAQLAPATSHIDTVSLLIAGATAAALVRSVRRRREHDRTRA